MGWLPYPGQLRLQAYSHLASGAMGVMYWHWGSLHNSFETYWKGLLSQDYSPNPTYLEAAGFGREIAEHAEALTGLTKRNHIAMMVSNDSLTALEWFGLESGFPRRYSGGGANYNDVFRWVYDALFDLNWSAWRSSDCGFWWSQAACFRLFSSCSASLGVRYPSAEWSRV